MHDDPLGARTGAIDFGAAVHLEPFLDPGQHGGHDPRSAYVERFWLPLIGPSTLALVRHLANRLDDGEDEVLLADVAAAIGLGGKSLERGQFTRTLGRARDFDLVRVELGRVEGPTLGVRELLAGLGHRQLDRLPAALRLRHGRVEAARDPRDAPSRAANRPMRSNPLGRHPSSERDRRGVPAPLARRPRR